MNNQLKALSQALLFWEMAVVVLLLQFPNDSAYSFIVWLLSISNFVVMTLLMAALAFKHNQLQSALQQAEDNKRQHMF